MDGVQPTTMASMAANSIKETTFFIFSPLKISNQPTLNKSYSRQPSDKKVCHNRTQINSDLNQNYGR